MVAVSNTPPWPHWRGEREVLADAREIERDWLRDETERDSEYRPIDTDGGE